MVAAVGRDTTLAWGAGTPPPVIAGMQTKNLTLGGTPLNITSDDDDGWSRRLAIHDTRQISFAAEGVLMDETMVEEWFDGNILRGAVFTLPSGATLTGDFVLVNPTINIAHDAPITFSATFESSGPIVRNPA